MPNKSINQRYLELLAQHFPNAAAATTEIINLEAIMELQKGLSTL